MTSTTAATAATTTARTARPEQGMLAGAVARALGVGVQTLHYYEREGLIPAPPRSAAGYRLYPPALVERVGFIRKAQALGLPLGEIREVMALAAKGASPCGRVRAALAAKLADVDRRLHDLQRFRDDLAALVADAPALSARGVRVADVCAIVEDARAIPPTVIVQAPLAPAGRRPRRRNPEAAD